MGVDAAAQFLIALVAPPRCGICGARPPGTAVLCDGCERGIVAAMPASAPVPGLDAAWSAAAYEGTPRHLVAALKFRHRLPLAARAAEAIATGAPVGTLAAPLVPVPAAPWRLRVRGHDPAEEIAYALAGIADLPFRPCLRRENGPRQVGRPRGARLAEPPRVRLAAEPPAAAVLVDDVLTTGSTLTACARALREGGAERVAAVTFARA